MNEERCIMCGEIIPEGRQVCKECKMNLYESKARVITTDIIEELKMEKKNFENCVSSEEVKLIKEWNSAIDKCISLIYLSSY